VDTNAFILNKEKLAPFIQKLEQKQPVTMVALGDSNTCNFSFTKGGKQWPELLQTQLIIHYKTQFVTLVNSGICGNTAQNGLERLDRDVLRYQPDLAIVTFGTNDANKNRTIEEFSSDISAIVERLTKNGTLVLLRTVTPIMEINPAPSHIWKNGERILGIIEHTRKIADSCSLPFIDIYSLWVSLEDDDELTIGDLMADEVHTNFEGHKCIARQLAAVFTMPETLHFD